MVLSKITFYLLQDGYKFKGLGFMVWELADLSASDFVQPLHLKAPFGGLP